MSTATSSAQRAAAAPQPALDVMRLREDFPILRRQVHGKPLVYLDNAATTQKPTAVLDALNDYYRTTNANVHRGVHTLSEQATSAYEGARKTVAHYLGATSIREIVFTRGTTEAINLVAFSWGRANLKAGDEILISHMEHHSNIVPWQLLSEQTGAVLRVAPINDDGELIFADFEKLLGERTKLVSVTHLSNALGTINPVKRIVERAHDAGAVVLLDGAQAAGHLPMNVSDLGCDFYAISGHKLFGPTGIGALYGREALLEAMPPYQGGGDMIKSVSFAGTVYNDPPMRFEAGTPHIAGAIGLAAALDYIESVGRERIAAWEHELLAYGTQALQSIKGLRLIGTAQDKAAVLSFVLDFAHPLDAGTIIDHQGVAVRTGHHCAQPTMERFGVPATLRASLAAYNTKAEIDALVESIEKVRRFLQ